jgi:GNAT superfamily N-acetyltransferase
VSHPAAPDRGAAHACPDNMKTIRYRFASAAEAPLLARLNAQLIATGADFGPAEPAELERRMRNWLNSGEDHAVLFEDARGRVRAYALYQEDAAEIYLRQFLVLDAARHGGVGRRAFALLRERIWSRRKRLTLEVLSSNRAGLRFWHELGYRDCAVTLEIPAPAPAARPATPHRHRRGVAVLLLASLLSMPAAASAPAPLASWPAFTGFLSTPAAARLEFIRPRSA